MPASRRSFLLAAAFAGALGASLVGPVALAPHVAHASTAVALTVDDLVEKSESIVVAIPKTKTSRWESGRIVTYTTVAIDTAVAGQGKAGGNFVVRTYGGVVDGIGQVTHGEANLVLEKPVVLFLRALPTPAKAATPKLLAGSMVITGMAQGAMAIETGADKIARVVPRPADLDLVPKPQQIEKGPLAPLAKPPAVVALSGRPLPEVVTELRTAWIARGKK